MYLLIALSAFSVPLPLKQLHHNAFRAFSRDARCVYIFYGSVHLIFLAFKGVDFAGLQVFPQGVFIPEVGAINFELMRLTLAYLISSTFNIISS